MLKPADTIAAQSQPEPRRAPGLHLTIAEVLCASGSNDEASFRATMATIWQRGTRGRQERDIVPV